MKKQGFIPLFVIGFLIVLGIGAFFRFALSFDAPWSIPEINDRLGIAIPQDAFNLVVIGKHGLSDGVGIEFDAPSASAEHFARQFCEGVLYRAYDPFNAIDVDEPRSNAYPINLGTVYYSYSPQEPDTTFGNRCFPPKNDQYLQVVLDTTNQNMFHVKVMQFFSCTLCRYPYVQPIS